MTFQYVVWLPPSPTKEQLHWAWWFTVMGRANGRCGCDRKLEAAHRQSRKARPDLTYDPENGMALCRRCHFRHDILHKHRIGGRPLGLKMADSWKRRHSRRMKRIYAKPELRAACRQRAIAQWRTGRKTDPKKPCEHCGGPLRPRQQYARNRFCTAACHYAFAKGKPRSGY